MLNRNQYNVTINNIYTVFVKSIILGIFQLLSEIVFKMFLMCNIFILLEIIFFIFYTD